MGTADQRLRQAREARGFTTASAAAQAMGVPIATYVQHENGGRGYPAKRAQQYGRFFGVTPEWLLYGRGDPPKSSAGRRAHVPLVGYVGAGAEAHFYASADEGLGEVDAPSWANDNTRAAEIRGTSLGPIFERWLIFYDDVRSPVTPDLHSVLCIVGLPDGRVLVKQLKPTADPQIFHLISNGSEPPIFDQIVSWAARVKEMRPR